MRPSAQEWFGRRTSAAQDWPIEQVLPAMGDVTVDVILPALDEEKTVGSIVKSIREHLMTEATPLVSDLVVVDSGSTDRTVEVARSAGARVVRREDVLTGVHVEPGKGEAMWRGLAATGGDLVVFIDADLTSFSWTHVPALIGPLLAESSVGLVKSVYDRPLITREARIAAAGGRVTEIMARPLLNQFWPDLSGVAQPLAGECAARRDLLEVLAFPCGYGVEIGLLVDTYDRLGLDGIAQVDLGLRSHRHQDERGLSRMSAEILAAALARLPSARSTGVAEVDGTIPVFEHVAGHLTVSENSVQVRERPPLTDLPPGERYRVGTRPHLVETTP